MGGRGIYLSYSSEKFSFRFKYLLTRQVLQDCEVVENQMPQRTIQLGISQIRFILGYKHRLYIEFSESHDVAQMKNICYYCFSPLSQPLLKFQQDVLLASI